MNQNNSIVIATQSELAPIIQSANALMIKCAEDMIIATNILSTMNRIMDKVEEEKNKVMRPLLDAVNAERARWSPIEKAYKGAIEPLRSKISVYQTEETKRQQAVADKLAKDIAKGKVSLDDASNVTLAGPETKITTTIGTLGFRPTPTLKITNAKLIPDKYWVIDETNLLADLKTGKKVKGAVVEIIQVPINRR